jgi:hypothetical protein
MAILGRDYFFGLGHTNIISQFNEGWKALDYQHNEFNDPETVTLWKGQGFHPREGVMYDMSREVPWWFDPETLKEDFPWENLGWSFYKMRPGDNLPMHVDAFARYKEKFDCTNKIIVRGLVMLEDWKSGHYLEVDDRSITNWHAGQYWWWTEKTPHMAANLGTEDRYTLQLTGLMEL